MTEEIHCQAIVLSSFNYRDYDRITTLYTDIKGIIKTIVLRANSPKSSKLIFCQPLTHLNLTYKTKKGEIHSFKEAKVINPHLDLRDSYDALQVGIKLLDLTAKSQLPEEPSPQIFQLLLTFLKKIPEFKNPWILSSSFILKLLILSGQWTLESKCTKCEKLLDEFYFANRSYYCTNCTPSLKLPFSHDEVHTLSSLIQEKSFFALNQLRFSERLKDKIEKLFLISHQ